MKRASKGWIPDLESSPLAFFHTSFQSTNPFPLSSSSIARAKPESLFEGHARIIIKKFCKSIDSIFYSTPQIFEEIMALRHSLLTLNKSVAIVFCLSSHCLCIMFMNCPYEREIILHHDHYLTTIIQMPISQI